MNDELLNELINAIVNLSKEDSLWKTWAPAISTVFGALLTGIFAFYAVSWQINKNHAYSNKMLLNTKKEELYIYLDLIKKEILHTRSILINAPTIADGAVILGKPDQQDLIHKINMVISIYLRQLNQLRDSLNKSYNVYGLTCGFLYQQSKNGHHVNGEQIENLLGISGDCLEKIDALQIETVNLDVHKSQ